MSRIPALRLPTTAQERLIVALDVEEADEAERFLRLLSPHVGLFKVGPRLFTRAGKSIMETIRGYGAETFLDLKLHDIPATVAVAAREMARLNVRMFTVHALGGPKMIRQTAAEIAALTVIPGALPPILLAVTILTSHTEEDLIAVGLEGPIGHHVERLARMAMTHGAQGLVASGHEVARLRAVVPSHTVIVTPGIRGPNDPAQDQARVMTPRQAVEAGATYVVVGRPICAASDPVAATSRILDDLEKARP